MKLKIEGCCRCGADHDCVELREFTSPPTIVVEAASEYLKTIDGGDEWTPRFFWGPCPTNGEPMIEVHFIGTEGWSRKTAALMRE